MGSNFEKVLDQGGENIDLAAEFSAMDRQLENTKDGETESKDVSNDVSTNGSTDDAPRGEKRTIDEVEK